MRRHSLNKITVALGCALVLIACGVQPPAVGVTASPAPAATSAPVAPTQTIAVAVPLTMNAPPTPGAPASPVAPEVPVATYRVINTYPHDPGAFTQGLVYENGYFFEGTGLNGQSTLRKVDLATGNVLQSRALEDNYFGEGIAVFGDRIFQLTWQSKVGFVYDKATFEPQSEFDYPTEGWGLTQDGQRLIMSDGTARLYFRDPRTFQEIGHVDVSDRNGPVANLNELEYVNGEIYANIWQTDRIARISPQTGQVLGWIDLSGLLTLEERQPPTDVLNGIAYDSAADRLFVTGKRWPKLFEIDVVAP
jgi:glutamine cyclotransferase